MQGLRRAGLLRDCLVIGFCIAALLFLLPFFWKTSPKSPPHFAWAPGYWEISPLLGIMRIVPLAPAMLINPTAAQAPAEIKADKNMQPIDRADL